MRFEFVLINHNLRPFKEVCFIALLRERRKKMNKKEMRNSLAQIFLKWYNKYLYFSRSYFISNSRWYNNISHDKLPSHFWVHMFSFFQSFLFFFSISHNTHFGKNYYHWNVLHASSLEILGLWQSNDAEKRSVFILVSFGRLTNFPIAIYVNGNMLNKTVICASPYH